VKCIKCNIENNLKERRDGNGRCKKCRHEFAFDPKVMPGVDFTDKFFQQTLQNLSVNDSLFFTSRQLYYFFNRRRNTKKASRLKVVAGCAIPVSVALTILLSLAVGFSVLWFAPLLIVVAFAVALLTSPNLRRRLRGTQPRELNASTDQVEGWYRRWCKINGDVAKLLPATRPGDNHATTAAKINPELKNYSFDRAVICDRSEVAQCLIANNFHFENNSAVLSLDGYPHDIFGDVMDMLRRNPALSVYALHDASKSGVELPHILSTETRWFAGSKVKIYDLGLLPRQIFNRSVFVERQSQRAGAGMPEQVAATLQSEEVRWLNAGNYVALESFPAQILLRVIAQGIAKSRDPQAGDALVPVMMSDRGGGVYFYAWDTFG
jgi:hypothetical protein